MANDLKWQKHAVRLIFFLSGMGCATWAPLVPIVKQRLGVTDDIMGMLILCIGLGAVFSMPFAGTLAKKYGCKKVIGITGLVFTLILLGIGEADSLAVIIPMLLIFGSGMSFVDVVMNINAVLVEKLAGKSIMSNFHAMWSIGCFVGAGLFSVWLSIGLSVMAAVYIGVAIMLAALVLAYKHLLDYGSDPNEKEEKSPVLAIPKGIVIFFSIMACISFLAEGSIADWSGLFITEVRGFDIALGGTAFSVYSIAMFICRMTGDYAVNKIGKKEIVLGGLALSFAGFMLMIFSPWAPLTFASFFLMGIGFANVVPVIYSYMGEQKDMPAAQAVAAVGTVGYAGVLGGPAVIGYIANATSLTIAFGLLSFLILVEIGLAYYCFVNRRIFSGNVE